LYVIHLLKFLLIRQIHGACTPELHKFPDGKQQHLTTSNNWNTFSPNGDTYNPTFQLILICNYDPFSYQMLLFNQLGKIIFETHNLAIGLDGTYSFTDSSGGVYTW
jgi:hypothetical protein